MNEPRRRRRFTAPSEPETPAAPPPLRAVAAVEAPEPAARAAEAPAGAPPLRQLTDRERADARTAEFLEHGGLNDLDDGQDTFYFPVADVPDGWTYEWKRRTVHNEENPKYMTQLAQNGWTNVPTSRHPEMMPSTGGPYPIIERDGQMLMERPKAITDAVRARDNRNARAQVSAKEQQLSAAPPGTFERGTHAATQVKLGKSFEKIVLPQD